MEDQQLIVFPDADGNWFIGTTKGMIGWIEYRGNPGALPFQVHQTKVGRLAQKTYVGNCDTVDSGVRIIMAMEKWRPKGGEE